MAKGETLRVDLGEEFEDDHKEAIASSDHNGHLQITLENQEEWWVFAAHWQLPWQVVVEEPRSQPEWNQVDWTDWGSPVSKYFTVGEVCNMSRERIPTEPTIKKNIIAIARRMDDIREWWGGPLGVNSWYRPWPVNRRIGSSAPNHPNGYGIDFRPLGGSVWELQKRFHTEWYNAGKWNGGFGLGARRGFIHLDLRHKRAWNY